MRCQAAVIILFGMVVLVGGSIAFAGSSPGTGLSGSEHDFSGIPAGGTVTGLCTFCHTSHEALETLLGQNHVLSPLTFVWCGRTETRYDTPHPSISPDYPGSSKVCLGCHSETVTVGAINWFNGESWTGGATLDPRLEDGGATPDGCIDHSHNDHPTAFPYPYQGVASTYNGVTSGVRAAEKFETDPTVFGIRLFREEGGEIVAGPAVGRSGIECSSCHDPHNGPTVGKSKFIRGDESICKKCHKDEE